MSGPGAIVFTDVVGFTRFTAAEGDARAVELLDVKRAIVDDLLPPRGRVVKELGDGLLLWIDDADDGVRFCTGLQQACRRAAEDGPFPLWVRIGAHWGEAAERGGDLIGHEVNTAARIVDQAGPGETLASEAFWARCDTEALDVDAEPIGPVLMKGLPAAVWLFRLTS